MAILSSAEARVQLETLALNLLFMSESDFPLSVIQLGKVGELNAPELLSAVGKSPTLTVERVTVDDFLGYAAQEQSFHSAAERAVAGRYRALLEFFNTALESARVFRVGSINIDAYAVGKSTDGEWLGVATKLVET